MFKALTNIIPKEISPSRPLGSLINALPAKTPLLMSLTHPLKVKKNDVSYQDNVIQLDPYVFHHPIRRDILHLCVVHHRDSLRQGTANTKTRAEVAGSGRKIMRQKGTGRARVGDAQSPIRRGGGTVFGPKPRDFSTKLPRKVIQMGMRVALSAKVKELRFGIMPSLDWPNGKTKHLVQKLGMLDLEQVVFVTGEKEKAIGLDLAIRNIPRVSLIFAHELNVFETVHSPRLILDLKAVEYFEKVLGKQTQP